MKALPKDVLSNLRITERHEYSSWRKHHFESAIVGVSDHGRPAHSGAVRFRDGTIIADLDLRQPTLENRDREKKRCQAPFRGRSGSASVSVNFAWRLSSRTRNEEVSIRRKGRRSFDAALEYNMARIMVSEKTCLIRRCWR